jgi:WD40 repeat protein
VRRIRVFISSPGDVSDERLRADLIVDKLSQEYCRFFVVESYRWEHEAMIASGHFQDAIEPPSKFDIVVLILWSRLGTPLPERTSVREYRGIDNRVPVTGTEWEYEEALKAAREGGAPDLLAFRNVSKSPVDPRDPEAQIAQLNALNTFWRRHFADRGVFLAAYDEFTTLDQFAARLEQSLRKLIERRVKVLAEGKDGSAPIWLKEPFRGLESYEFEHAPIFFGRDGLVTRAIERLAGNATRGSVAFLLISGASGSGKSSLVKAGIVPRLMKPQRIPGSAFVRRTVMRPAAAGGDLVLGLAQALTRVGEADAIGLPELIGPGQDVHQLAGHLRGTIDSPGFPFANALGRLTIAGRQEGRILSYEEAKLVLIVDQLEEMFTGTDDGERRNFIKLLSGLARSGSVWVICTLRADFWPRAAQIVELTSLADGLGRLDVANPSAAEFAEMISRPAKTSGLTFQSNRDTNITLDLVLAEDAAAAPAILPLLSFTLDELYKDARKRQSNELTYECYESLGKLKGAITQRADAIVNALPMDAQAALPRVLRALATVSSGIDEMPVGRAAPLDSFVEGSPARILINALIAARLLVASTERDRATVRLAHEALVSRWKRAFDQLTLDRRDLETRTLVEAQYERWSQGFGRARYQLLLRDPDLANGVALARRWGEELDAKLRDFIRRSRQRALLRRAFAVAAAMVVGLIIVSAIVAADNAARANKQSQISQLVAFANANLREGHVQPAIEFASQAFDQSPSFETRSAFLPALMALSPYLVGRLDVAGSYSPAQAWIDTDTLAYATFGGELMFLDVSRSGRNNLSGIVRNLTKSGKSGDETSVLALRPIAPDHVVAVLQDGSIVTLSVRGSDVQVRAPETPVNVNPSAQSVAIGPDGMLVAVAPTDAGPRIVDCKSGNGIQSQACVEIELTPTPAGAVELSTAADRVAVGGDDGIVQIFSSSGGAAASAPLHAGFPVASLAWNPYRDWLAVGGADGSVALFDVVTSKEIGRASVAKSLVGSLAWNPKGDQLAFVCDESVVCWAYVRDDGNFEPAANFVRFAGHSGHVRRVSFASDGVHLVTSDDAHEVMIWSTNPDRRVAFELRSPDGTPVAAIAYGPADRRLAAAYSGGHVGVWNSADVLTRDMAHQVEESIRLRGRPSAAQAVAWRSDGQLSVGYQDGRIVMWQRDLKDRQHVFELPTAPLQIGFIQQGTRMVVLGDDDRIRLFDPAKLGDATALGERALLGQARAFVVEPTLDIVYESNDGGQISASNLMTGLRSGSMSAGDSVAALGLAVDPGGHFLATTGGDRFINVFDLASQKLLIRLPLPLEAQGQETAGSVAFSVDGSFLAALGGDGRVYIWQYRGGSFEMFVIVGFKTNFVSRRANFPGAYNAALAWTGPRDLAIATTAGSVGMINLDTVGWQARRNDLYFKSDRPNISSTVRP